MNDAATAPGRGRPVVAYILGTWFGCGLSPRAPGTAGTLGALPLYWLVARWGWGAVLGTACAVTMAGIWASEAIVRHRRDEDPQLVCIDEVAGVLFALAAAPFTWAGVAVAVVAFRVFDMTKPWPASRLQHAPGGLGVVLDDVAAGGWAALVVVAGRLAGWL